MGFGRKWDVHELSVIKKTAFPEGNRKAAMETGKMFGDRIPCFPFYQVKKHFATKIFVVEGCRITKETMVHGWEKVPCRALS